MPATDVLATLADGAVHSGADLADQQGLSRTAMCKQIATLETLGINVKRVRGQGYQIEGGLDLLDEGVIRDSIAREASAQLRQLNIHQSIDSTNAELRRQTPFGAGASVCLAESQSAGRGRRGRSWVSPFASSIYMSIGWQFRGGVEVLEGLSLAIGVAVGDALRELGVDGLALKWPNDIYLSGKKLAGILVEMSGDFSGPCDVVIGVGINVQLPDDAAEGIEQPWSDLRGSGQGVFTRNVLVGKLLSHLLPALVSYEKGGFTPWRERWLAMDAFAGRQVIVENDGRRLSGTAAGVDNRGALLLSTTAGVQTIYGGEVSLRLQEPVL